MIGLSVRHRQCRPIREARLTKATPGKVRLWLLTQTLKLNDENFSVLWKDISRHCHTAEFTADDYALWNERSSECIFRRRLLNPYIHRPVSWIRLGSSLHNF